MNITSTDMAITLETDNLSNTYPINSLGYQKTDNGISVLCNGSCLATAPISEIMVDGQPLSNENADELLGVFFRSGNAGSSSGSGSQGNQGCAFSKAVFSDPLVYPTPIRPGHIVCFYEGETLRLTYEWNGWLWVLKGGEPNLIFTVYDKEGMQNAMDSGFECLSMIDSTIYVATEPNKYYIYSTIDTNYIEKIDTNYTLDKVNFIKDYNTSKHYPEAKATIPPFRIKEFTITTFDKQNDQNDENSISEIILDNSFCEVLLCDSSINLKSVVYRNLCGVSQEYIQAVTAKTQNLLVEDCQLAIGYFYIKKDLNDEGKISNVQIRNNKFGGILDDKYEFDIEPKNLTIAAERDCSERVNVSIKNNIGLELILLSRFNNGSIINSLDLDFDENSLSSVTIQSCDFSVEALSSLIDALTVKTFVSDSRSFSYDTYSTPALTQEQKDRLTASGWNIQ